MDDYQPQGPLVQLAYSKSVHEFLQEVGQLIDFSYKCQHEYLGVQLPRDVLRWPSTAAFPERDWGTVGFKIGISGLDVDGEITLARESLTGQLHMQENYWSIQDAQASFTLHGAVMSIGDVRMLIAYLAANFYASNFNVSAKE